MDKENQIELSVCIDAVFEGEKYDDAFKSIKQSGISTIEFWSWWDKDLNDLIKAQIESKLKVAACCTKFVSLVDPSHRNEYIIGLEESIVIAKKINTKILISQVGDFVEGLTRQEQYKSLVEGLKEVAPLLEEADVTLVIEPLNDLIDHQGYYLVKSDEAFKIIEEVNSPNIKVLFDIYHQQISEGQLIRNIVSNIDKIGHFHAAGNPGRNELQKGEINYKEIFKAIKSTTYSGFIGLEYWPLDNNPIEALSELSSWFY